jgi:hypothetical protein
MIVLTFRKLPFFMVCVIVIEAGSGIVARDTISGLVVATEQQKLPAKKLRSVTLNKKEKE